ncbi:hypothetical protein CCMSSC00406_0009908 [Pleurotus cornucopiae]|uniref:Uncharacterized protein n=1 Tax=Pleurotus cornucopiae TaxID=5321 RepID=A0ACB7IT73_PLECO|nr:hypothetical protein CCMSSC00406_0009908 [Pleurotus cornucopiae]
MGKHVARHWHLLMWKHLGCQRPPLLGLLENIIWTTLRQVAARPKEIPQAMASLYEHLKEMTRYDKKNNTFELEVEPGCREFYKSLEPLFYVPTSANEGPALAQPALAPRTPQTPPSNTSTHPPAAGPSGLNALRGNSPPPDGPLSPLTNTGSNPDTEIGKGDNNGGGQDEPRADKGDAGKGEGPRGGGKRKRGDDDNDERDDDAHRTEDPDFNLDAGKVGGGQEPGGSSKRRRGDDDTEDDAEDNNENDKDKDDDNDERDDDADRTEDPDINLDAGKTPRTTPRTTTTKTTTTTTTTTTTQKLGHQRARG